jgi:hypothetical protein
MNLTLIYFVEEKQKEPSRQLADNKDRDKTIKWRTFIILIHFVLAVFDVSSKDLYHNISLECLPK